MNEVNCATDCWTVCQLSTHGYCPKPRKLSAEQIASELRKHQDMSISDFSEIVMALAGVVSRSDCLDGSEIAERIDSLSVDLETASDGALEAMGWELME